MNLIESPASTSGCVELLNLDFLWKSVYQKAGVSTTGKPYESSLQLYFAGRVRSIPMGSYDEPYAFYGAEADVLQLRILALKEHS